MERAKPKSQADWQKFIELQADSDQTVRDFCKTHRLSTSAFYKYKAQLKQDEGSAFTKMHVVRAVKPPAKICCLLPSGLRLEWDETVDTDRIVSLLRSLA